MALGARCRGTSSPGLPLLKDPLLPLDKFDQLDTLKVEMSTDIGYFRSIACARGLFFGYNDTILRHHC